MKHRLVALAMGIALAGSAHAGPQGGGLSTGEPRAPARPALSLRLVADSAFDPDPVHHSGIVTSTEIAPNAMLGLGLLKSAPKRPSGEWNLDNRAPRSRKGLVSFLLKF